jgi:hypothetical protein
MRAAGKEVDGFWVKRFVERNAEKLAIRQAVFLEEDRYNVNPAISEHTSIVAGLSWRRYHPPSS